MPEMSTMSPSLQTALDSGDAMAALGRIVDEGSMRWVTHLIERSPETPLLFEKRFAGEGCAREK
jgi:hypothetical protein